MELPDRGSVSEETGAGVAKDEGDDAYENNRNDLSGYRSDQRTADQNSGSAWRAAAGKGDSVS